MTNAAEPNAQPIRAPDSIDPNTPEIKATALNTQNGLSDFIFGTLATDADRIAALSQARRGVGAPMFTLAEGAGTVQIMVGPDVLVVSVTVYFTTDGSDPQPGAPHTLTRQCHALPPSWDTILWGYTQRYETVIPASVLPPGTIVRMRVIGYTLAGEPIPAGGGRRYAFPTASPAIPAWLRRAVIYHIFVDRFAPDPGQAFATPASLAGFYGGTLRGILDQLPYLAELGVDTLWLSPIMPSPSHHGYDATDFCAIEPRLGTAADLQALVEAAHARQLRVLLDFVPNHISNEHPFFTSAQTDPHSPYRDYFTWQHWPDKYESFFGVATLPQLANDQPGARQYTIHSAQYWLEAFGVDGFRLDYAYGPSHDFWVDYYTAVKQSNPDSVHFGEIVETPELLRSYVGRLDGALDFHFLQAVRKTFAYDTLSIEAFDYWLTQHLLYFANQQFALPTFLDNHDLNRFLWAAHGDVRRLKLAALVQFTLPPPPIIYYGTETGLSQARDIRYPDGRGVLEESRQPMNWDAIDTDLLTFYKQLIAARRTIASALNGTRATLIAGSGQYVYGYYADVAGQYDGELVVLTAINHTAASIVLRVPVAGAWRDLLSGEQHAEAETLSITLAPESGTILARL